MTGIDRVAALIAAAVACQACGEEHLHRRIDDGATLRILHGQPQPVHRYSWGHPVDGHAYRPLDVTVEWMRTWAAANPEVQP